MKKVNYAAIDVGSNAVRLLIKGVDKEAMTPDEKFSKELLLRVPLRLGFVHIRCFIGCQSCKVETLDESI